MVWSDGGCGSVGGGGGGGGDYDDDVCDGALGRTSVTVVSSARQTTTSRWQDARRLQRRRSSLSNPSSVATVVRSGHVDCWLFVDLYSCSCSWSCNRACVCVTKELRRSRRSLRRTSPTPLLGYRTTNALSSTITQSVSLTLAIVPSARDAHTKRYIDIINIDNIVSKYYQKIIISYQNIIIINIDLSIILYKQIYLFH